MSEFDFDELDRAVNQVLTGDQPISSDVSSSSAPVVTPAPRPAPVESRPVETPAARRAASGRFMDLVHPSSDMRTSTPSPAPQQPAKPAPVSPPVPVQKPAPWASDHHVPTGPSGIPTTQPATLQVAEDELVFGEEPRAMESPFLPDAKVEKRPLGGAATQDEPVLNTAPSLSKSIEEALAEVSLVESEEEAPVWPTAAPAETPTEKLLDAPEPIDRLESQELLEEGKTADFSAPFVQEKTLGDIPNPHADTGEAPVGAPAPTRPQPVRLAPTPVADPTPVVPVAVPAGPPSITQQYTEKPSTSAEPGAIYDTESYHQPIALKTKKKSGSWTILWVILLVIAGAGAGAAFYLYVLPLL